MSGPLADQLSLSLVAVAIGGALFFFIRQRPDLGATVWIAALAFVPVWFTVPFVVDFPPAPALGLLVLAALAPFALQRLTVADLLVVALLGLTVLPLAVGGGSLATAFVGAVHWGTGFLLGRLLPGRVKVDLIHRVTAVVFTAVAALAVIEFLTQVNPFISLSRSNPEFSAWGDQQVRGDVFRSEAAFGHSIALGASLALAIPLTVVSRLPVWVRTVMVMIMLAGVAVTFSRGAMISAVLALVLVLTLRSTSISQGMRWSVGLGASVAGVASLVLVSSVFSSAGPEAQRSADYRWDLFRLLPHVSLLGRSDVMGVDPTGRVLHGDFRSIDNALLLLGLRYGWLPLLIAVVLLTGACILVLRRRGGAATTAVVAQLPMLLTVALITQYSTWFWFVVGLALASLQRRPPADVPQPCAVEADAAVVAPSWGRYEAVLGVKSQKEMEKP